MRLREDIQKRLFLLLLGIGGGFIISFVVVFMWLVFKGYVLGYGDSGPEWVNKITDTIQLLSILICAILSQLIFTRGRKKGKV